MTGARTIAALLGAVLATGCPGDKEERAIPTAIATEQSFARSVFAEGNLKAVKATPITTPAVPGVWRPMTIAWLIENGTEVKQGELVAKFDGSQLEKNRTNNEADVAAANAKLAREGVEGRRAALARESAAKLADLSLESTRKFSDKDPEIYSRNQIIEAMIDEQLSIARRRHAEAAKKIEKGVSRSKAQLIAVERKKYDLEVANAKAGLASLELRAPHDGLLILRRNWRGEVPKVGDEQWAGSRIAELPELGSMEAEIFVLEVDGGELEKDMAVTIAIESQPGKSFTGKIKSVDKLAKPRINGVPVQYFRAVVSLDETQPAIMKPGQRVRATIALGESDALVIPRHAVFEEKGEKVVYRRDGDEFAPIVVELGAASAGRVVIKGGLSAGDVVALENPTARSGKGQGSASAGSAINRAGGS